MTGLSDSFQRPINYLRLSVTDRCNLRCVYCMPAEGISLLPAADILSYEEIARVVRAAASLGITKIRLTGGEPLVRSGLPSLVGMLARIPGVDDLSLTTNGLLLARYARELKEAGLKRVNVSLDTLRTERFPRLTRGGQLQGVLAGLEAGRAAGLEPIKINTVVIRGLNDDELLDFARKTGEEGWHVRFIELMPFGEQKGDGLVPVAEMMERLSTLGGLEPVRTSPGNGPARYYRLPGTRGTIGFISPVTEHFCTSCNRLRLTASGQLRLCLLSDASVDLRGPLRRGASLEELATLLREGANLKPQGHRLHLGPSCADKSLAPLGG